MTNKPPNTKPTDKTSSRNEYIPSFIASTPFYAADLLDQSDYLQHQRNNAAPKDTLATSKWYSRSKSGPAATKYRKGACENCGAISHKTKECLSRPRKTGAKYTGVDIQADETVERIEMGYDAKRDRWNGYDAKEYDAVVDEYRDLENLRNGGAEENFDESGEMGREQLKGTRQLRLREDTAGYLRNLDLDSAKYDPKTRTMDDTARLNDSMDQDVAQDGFVQASHQLDPASDAAAFEKAQKFAWEKQQAALPPDAKDKEVLAVDASVHLQANPTASLVAHKKFLAEQKEKQDEQKRYLLEKYGTTDTTTTKPIAAGTANERYVEYDPETGRVIDQNTGKPVLRQIAKSKYPEDVFPGNHTSVFGSYWKDFQWGYACCHSFVKNSYCTGEEGKKAFEEEQAQKRGLNLAVDESLKRKADESLEEISTQKRMKDEDG
ncbi:hypothetical protein BT93_L4361 [Corymbia citriodora subsp. variegata]|uniref:Pre-mRNA-splicing factor SLU7 n=1 Tax=Corymbia citriodora subsp. variegata TaxID=360336 RepID=A0A8T0CH22_CORYI|nr:hypothetical protein BT93_L4361 [Corymbia citriodora subsp. variegata]